MGLHFINRLNNTVNQSTVVVIKFLCTSVDKNSDDVSRVDGERREQRRGFSKCVGVHTQKHTHAHTLKSLTDPNSSLLSLTHTQTDT